MPTDDNSASSGGDNDDSYSDDEFLQDDDDADVDNIKKDVDDAKDVATVAFEKSKQ